MTDLTKTHKISEEFRIYSFPNDEQITILQPKELIVGDSGTHRITTIDGDLHIVPPTWLHIRIKSNVGKWEV